MGDSNLLSRGHLLAIALTQISVTAVRDLMTYLRVGDLVEITTKQGHKELLTIGVTITYNGDVNLDAYAAIGKNPWHENSSFYKLAEAEKVVLLRRSEDSGKPIKIRKTDMGLWDVAYHTGRNVEEIVTCDSYDEALCFVSFITGEYVKLFSQKLISLSGE